jgi:dTDP-glucose 4,6-dehydratase
MKRYLITGGFGFIGSNLLRKLGENPLNEIMVVDCLTYAAQPEWAYAAFKDRNKFHFENQDIFRSKRLASTVVEFNPDVIIHLAAESHVCRSIEGPHEFFETNIMGTFKMLEAARKLKERGSNAVFHHVSTDEVFGELDAEGKFDIQSPYAPRSPYAASKASSDHLVNSYFHTYGINTRISNCSNNFGPNQHAEKLIPKTIERALAGRAATIYSPETGSG